MGSVGGLVVPEVDDLEAGGEPKYTERLDPVEGEVGVSELETIAERIVVFDGVEMVVLEHESVDVVRKAERADIDELVKAGIKMSKSHVSAEVKVVSQFSNLVMRDVQPLEGPRQDGVTKMLNHIARNIKILELG